MADQPVPATQPDVLEVDPDHLAGENDSALGDVSDEYSAFSQSLTPSVTDYPEEHGRRYHAYRAGIYILPNDDVCAHPNPLARVSKLITPASSERA